MNHRATYSPEDNKLRLYPACRLEKELYERVRGAGFAWAPRQELFVAPMWTPSREDFLIKLCGEVGDEDTSLVDRAEERAERFTEYHENRTADAEAAHKAVHAIADNIPLGQPILVGHHSERHARKDAEKIENGMRKAVKMWDTAQYWKQRAAGAIHHAKYKERPDVRARRIKGLEADLRKYQREQNTTAKCLKYWTGELDGHAKDDPTKIIKIPVCRSSALWFCNHYDQISMCFPLDKYPRQAPASQYEGFMSLWSALGGSDAEDHAIITIEQAQELAIDIHTRAQAHRERWIAHTNNRIEYERAMLAEAGGTVAEKTGPEVGGGCRCWASPRGGWSYIQKVNKVSVTVLDQVGGWRGTRTMPFDKLTQIMSKAQVDAARASGELIEDQHKIGFFLCTKSPEPTPPPQTPPAEDPKEKFDALRDTLRTGVQVVSVPQLFPTPPDVVQMMIYRANLHKYPRLSILEPSAGTGNILEALKMFDAVVTAVEINGQLEEALSQKYNPRPAGWTILHDDFLTCNGKLGQYDRVLMNPPFENGADIKHIERALTLLKPGGRLVAICANGSRQNEKLKPLAVHWEDLPRDTFSGTSVNAALLVIDADDTPENTAAQGGLFT